MGRRPKPTAIKILHGDFKKNPQLRNKEEPEAPPGRPTCPTYLPRLAKLRWRQMCTWLEMMNLQTQPDAAAMERYCLYYAAWREAEKHLAQDGAVIQAEGGPRINPWHYALRDASLQMTKFEIEFGFTPAARSKIRVETKPKPESVMRRNRG